MHPRVARAVMFLQEHLAERITLPDVAKAAGLSVSRLAHLFLQTLHVPPMQFLEHERIEQAKLLLHFAARSVQDIAGDVGFDNALYFTRRFRERVRCSPRQYRRAQQRTPMTGLLATDEP